VAWGRRGASVEDRSRGRRSGHGAGAEAERVVALPERILHAGPGVDDPRIRRERRQGVRRGRAVDVLARPEDGIDARTVLAGRRVVVDDAGELVDRRQPPVAVAREPWPNRRGAVAHAVVEPREEVGVPRAVRAAGDGTAG